VTNTGQPDGAVTIAIADLTIGRANRPMIARGLTHRISVSAAAPEGDGGSSWHQVNPVIE